MTSDRLYHCSQVNVAPRNRGSLHVRSENRTTMFDVNEEEESPMSDPLIALLNDSMANKRGVTVALNSGPVALVVTEITDTTVTGRSQQHDRIVVRIDQIQAAYM